MFDKATRKKLRFSTGKGDLSVEDIWDLSLTAASGRLSLDGLAQETNKRLKASQEESFVKPAAGPASDDVMRLEILKHVIKIKMDERDAEKKKAERKAERELIMAAIARKENQALEEADMATLRKRLADLEEA